MKYLKLFEAYTIDNRVKDLINWNLINDLKEMSLEYIDDNCFLTMVIRVVCGFKLYTYSLRYNHERDELRESCSEYTTSIVRPQYSNIKIYNNPDDTGFSWLNSDYSKELQLRIMEAYPDENILY